MQATPTQTKNLHRHIGGLEIFFKDSANKISLHRHIGGLETKETKGRVIGYLHRHIGGLEKKGNPNEN